MALPADFERARFRAIVPAKAAPARSAKIQPTHRDTAGESLAHGTEFRPGFGDFGQFGRSSRKSTRIDAKAGNGRHKLDALAGLSVKRLKEIFSLFNVAGYSAAGRVTQDRRKT
jgi:hypothetical protein